LLGTKLLRGNHQSSKAQEREEKKKRKKKKKMKRTVQVFGYFDLPDLRNKKEIIS
jgi:hypothetical protein